ncbi:Electron transfer flavoprotein, beta subunit [Syntrophomonas zehnderi OL-4]|uniref:Electron transfer flavoprotein, beta subunit n=1 Tax=Syntrophomonas zehnderi OL-4 TaxID=690567 RepID=A0A0E4GBY7_9FIRM|nr:electron transfer flavoprotein subunit beta/FixA family protein [Syntrophomonas zehnderi]CFY03079.1 Electron transfer flavoprotein, beta subunit [Syntrophomonas zehnderi OL-4]
MNIVVAMKQIPDLQQVRIRNRQPVFEDVPYTLGNIDKNALEAGVALKEALDAKLIVVSAGNEELEDTIKEALAAGADEAYLVIDDSLDNIASDTSATLIAAAIKKIDDVGIILFGEGSGDNYSGQVASRVAEILELPEVGYAKEIELNGQSLRVTRSLEESEELVEVELPTVITVVSEINEARIPAVTQILKAGKKPKEVVSPHELEIAIGSVQVTTLSNLAPETDRKQIVVKSVDELVKALTTEGLIGR